ncbi:MAG: hypothetical protein KDD50_02375 [Bdellovibrionales bacterium]|nr:hypothetical protein [Bdellovibrionales bacterium]
MTLKQVTLALAISLLAHFAGAEEPPKYLNSCYQDDELHLVEAPTLQPSIWCEKAGLQVERASDRQRRMAELLESLKSYTPYSSGEYLRVLTNDEMLRYLSDK